MNEYLSFAKRLALKAGEKMLHYFDTGLSGREKEDKQLVSVADEEINQMVITEVEKNFPEHSVLGEEASSTSQKEYIWVCDPIDGTIPFLKGVPISTFSLALVKDGKPIVGVVYDPYTKRLYSGATGQGAYLNDRKISVSKNDLGGHSIVNVEWWPEAEIDLGKAIHRFSKETETYTLNIGSAVNASCLVASGKYEAVVFAGTKGKNVDIAAVKVIVEEAGGKVTDIAGNEQRYDRDINGAIISNGIVHDKILRFFQI